MGINPPRQKQNSPPLSPQFLITTLKEITSRFEFRITFLCLAWFLLSRAKTEQQFFPPFLVFCIALLQFRLSGYSPRTKIPSLVGNLGVIWYVFWIAVSLFVGLYGGLVIQLSSEDYLLVMAAKEYVLLRELIHYLFGVDYFPLLYIWLGTFFVALFDWSFMLSTEEKHATAEIQNHARNKKKKSQ